MASVFQYFGRDLYGRPTRGIVTASDQHEAVALLLGRQVWVTAIGPKRTVVLGLSRRTVSARDLATFCHQMSALLRAGVSPAGAIRLLAKEGSRPDLRKTLQAVGLQLDDGVSLSRAFGCHPRAFSGQFCSMVEAGELTGQLDMALDRLGAYYERESTFNSRVLGALTYPLLILTVAAVVLVVLFVFILPTFHSMLTTLNISFPPSTAAVFAVSFFIQKHALLLTAVFLIVVVAVWLGYCTGGPVRTGLDRLFFRIPVVGSLVLYSAVSRMCYTLGGLIVSGVPILTALEIVERMVGNQALASILVRARVDISEGKPLATAFRQERLIPGIVSEMLAVGEATGALDSLLDRVAGYFDQEADARVARITTVLQPVLLVGVSGLVAVILFAVLLPMFDTIWSIY